MSLPGLGLDESDDDVPGLGQGGGQSGGRLVTTSHELSKETEWRFEIGIGKSAEIKVSSHSGHC